MTAAPPVRIMIGRDVQVIGQEGQRVSLKGALRLRPGQRIEIVSAASTGAPNVIAVVETWRVGALEKRGPTYRGTCRLEPPAGTDYPAGGQPTASGGSVRRVT